MPACVAAEERPWRRRSTGRCDAVIIGSGPGGAAAAAGLVNAGARVLLLERGGWLPRTGGANRTDVVGLLSPAYHKEVGYTADTDAGSHTSGAFHCVGGQSVFYGAVALRFRERDFQGDDEVRAQSDARWPFDYEAMEPYYAQAEALLGVSGDARSDPTEPWRSDPYPGRSPALSPTGDALHGAARRMGQHPFRPPLAINRVAGARPACEACGACDGYACAIGAKGDAAGIVASLLGRGLELRTGCVAVRLRAARGRVTAVECLDLASSRRFTVRGDAVVLAAGALATPQLLLASDLHRHNPAGHVVGRYLLRHCNAVVCGFFPDPPGGGRMPFKEIAVHDFYFGHPRHPDLGRVGNIQQVGLPAPMVRAQAPRLLRPLAGAVLPHLMGLMVMAEDQPVRENGVSLDSRRTDAAGLPRLRIRHRYTARDRRARRILVTEAKGLLRSAGALACVTHPIDTFSHALGTVRMGSDRETSALDAGGRFRGIANLFVADGSALPTSAAVNPSLTIAAHALRVADRIACGSPTPGLAARKTSREAIYVSS